MKERKFLMPLAALVSLISTDITATVPVSEKIHTVDFSQTENSFDYMDFIVENSEPRQHFARHYSHSSHRSHSSHYSSTTKTYPQVIEPVNKPITTSPATIYVPSEATGLYKNIPIYDITKK